jgi:CRP/FNR family cyclic AMP-dependent transcriptional regulator
MGVQLATFSGEDNPRVCAAGETIFNAHDMGAEMYVILAGEVELSIDGKVIEVLGAGEPFGEMALIDQAPRVATATAKTSCKLAVIPERRFLFMVAQSPQFALEIMKVMADRLRRMNARLEA